MQLRYSFAAILTMVALAGARAQETVYRDLGTAGYLPTTFVYTNNEVGDDLNLGGVGRSLALITFAYNADIASPQCDERVKVRIRNLSGATPTTLIWESGLTDLRPGFHMVAIRVPSITVPNSIAVTVQFQGMAGGAGDRAALVKWNSPTVGTSAGTYAEFSGGSWSLIGTSDGNFGMSLTATAEPKAYDTYANGTGFYYPSPNEYGDTVYVENSGRRVTQFEAEVYGDFTVPQGDETMTIRFYKHDATSYKPTGAALYSTTVPLVAGTNAISVTPNVAVTPEFVYTVGFNNMAYQAGDRAGLVTADPAVTGWSGDYFVEYDGAPNWAFMSFSPAPVANFKVRITTSQQTDTTIGSIAIGPGSVLSGTFADLATSNDVRLNSRPGAVLIASNPPLVINFSATTATLSPDEIKLVFEGNCSVSTLQQRIFLYVPTSNTYEEVDSRLGPITDQAIDTVVNCQASRYVNQSTGEVRCRVTYKANGAVLVYPWQGRIDQVVFRIYP